MKRAVVGVVVGAMAVVGSGSYVTSAAADTAPRTTQQNHAFAVASANVKADEAPVQFSPNLPKVDAAAAKGKTVAYVPIDGTIPFTAGLWSGFSAAMKSAGVSAAFFDTDGTPADWSKAVLESVGRHVGAIVLQGENPGEIAPAISAANKAHIPVIESFIHSAGQPVSPGTRAEVTYSVAQIGKEMADEAIVATHANVDSIAIGTDSPVSEGQLTAIRAEFAALCPATCHIGTVYNVATNNWATQIPTITSSAVAAHAGLNVIFPLTDGMVTYVVPSLDTVHANTKVKLISFNATPGVMSYMTESDHVLVGEVGNPLAWAGFILADQALRAMTGARPIPSAEEPVPLRLFTPQNFTESIFKGPQSKWYGSTNYSTDYLKLWGLG